MVSVALSFSVYLCPPLGCLRRPSTSIALDRLSSSPANSLHAPPRFTPTVQNRLTEHTGLGPRGNRQYNEALCSSFWHHSSILQLWPVLFRWAADMACNSHVHKPGPLDAVVGGGGCCWREGGKGECIVITR